MSNENLFPVLQSSSTHHVLFPNIMDCELEIRKELRFSSLAELPNGYHKSVIFIFHTNSRFRDRESPQTILGVLLLCIRYHGDGNIFFQKNPPEVSACIHIVS